MAAEPNPNIRAVPNPPRNDNPTQELVKTVAITSAVSSLVGVFAVAGGQALFALIKRAIAGPKKNPVAAAPPPAAPAADYYDDEMPESLRMSPRLRHTGPRKQRRNKSSNTDEIKQMFTDFETKIEERLRSTEQRIEDFYEDEDE